MSYARRRGDSRAKVGPDRPPFSPAEAERLKRDHLEIYNSGARCAFSLSFPGPRTADGFPAGFHRWRADWRDAWRAGFDEGLHDRIRGVWALPRGERR